jgi:hypothetical protein
VLEAVPVFRDLKGCLAVKDPKGLVAEPVSVEAKVPPGRRALRVCLGARRRLRSCSSTSSRSSRGLCVACFRSRRVVGVASLASPSSP